MSPKTLLVLSGPVGIGKSTTTVQTANLLRLAGIPTAILDLDEIYRMLRQEDGFDSAETWQQARHGAAHLAAFAFQSVAQVVIIEGGFHSPEELADLTAGPNGGANLQLVTLTASYAEVLRRVQADTDPRRVASKVPAFLRQLYDEFAAALPFLRSRGAVLAVDSMPPARVAEEVAALVAPQVIPAVSNTHAGRVL